MNLESICCVVSFVLVFYLNGTKVIERVFLHYSYKLTMGLIVVIIWKLVIEDCKILGSLLNTTVLI